MVRISRRKAWICPVAAAALVAAGCAAWYENYERTIPSEVRAIRALLFTPETPEGGELHCIQLLRKNLYLEKIKGSGILSVFASPKQFQK